MFKDFHKYLFIFIYISYISIYTGFASNIPSEQITVPTIVLSTNAMNPSDEDEENCCAVKMFQENFANFSERATSIEDATVELILDMTDQKRLLEDQQKALGDLKNELGELETNYKAYDNEMAQSQKSNFAELRNKVTSLDQEIKGVKQRQNNLESTVNTLRNEMTSRMDRKFCAAESRTENAEMTLKAKGFTYKFECSYYHISNDNASWDDAVAKCQQLGGYLVKLNNDQEFQFLQNMINGHNMWIGLNDKQTDDTFIWTNDNTQQLISSIQSWFHPGEPNSPVNGAEDCIHYWNANGKLLLNDDECWEIMRYICEANFEM